MTRARPSVRVVLALCCALALEGAACAHPQAPRDPPPSPANRAARPPPGSFGDDLAFLRRHTEVVVLDGGGGALVAVAPQYQGRVMTSSAGGADGTGFGWINREVIASRTRQPHMTVLGGEDRFWLGPEAGQFGLYFAPGASFDFEHWQVPEAIDWGAWPITRQGAREVAFARDMSLTNHSGYRFELQATRRVRLLSRDELAGHLGVEPAGSVARVGYESINTVTNTGAEPWTRDTGLLSIWILGMYRPSPTTTVVLPYVEGPDGELGPVVNDAYFGAIAADRLVVGDGVIFFRGDGRSRGKIGVPRPRATPLAGSYDSANRILTVVQLNLPHGGDAYVNSLWKHQDAPFSGDVINSYNDGPPAPGKPPLGPFYELETSSPAAALAPGERITHIHRTIHLQGPRDALEPIAKATLGVSLDTIEQALPRDDS